MPTKCQQPVAALARRRSVRDAQVARHLAAPSYNALPSHGHLTELLVLNEEMVVELTLEREGASGTIDHLTGYIDQHQTIAGLLRGRLENPSPASASLDPVIPRSEPVLVAR